MDSEIQTGNVLDNLNLANSFECNIEELQEKVQHKVCNLTIVSQNIRSIYSNIDDFQVTMTELNFDIDILVLTECRIQLNKPIPNIINYNSFHTKNRLNQNDGVTTYIKNSHAAKVKEIILENASCIEISLHDLVILCIYRSPSINNADNFINSLSKHLYTIKSYEKIVLVGDININIIQKETEVNWERNNRLKYLSELSIHGILPGHYIPTRGNSCLDHIMLKMKTLKTTATIAVLHTTITDHLMVFLSLSKSSSSQCYKTKIITDYKNSLLSLMQYLKEFNFSGTPDIITDNLILNIQKSLKDNTKISSIPKCKRIIKPWITPGILRCIRNRNKMQKKPA